MVAAGTYGLVLTATGPLRPTGLRQPIVVDAFAVALSATRLKAGQAPARDVRVGRRRCRAGRPSRFDQAGRPPVTRFATSAGPGR